MPTIITVSPVARANFGATLTGIPKDWRGSFTNRSDVKHGELASRFAVVLRALEEKSYIVGYSVGIK